MRRLALAALAVAAVARAQMPMIDPTQMSGIPRPDPSVPAGTLSIRVLRGDFAHPVIGQEVTLEGPDGKRSVKVDETDHAVFSGLQAGATYTARASNFGEDLASQPIEMPSEAGVKLMLVFHADEKAQLGEADGVARTDEKLPAGALQVKVVDENDKPLAGLELVLAHARKGGEQVDEKRAATDGDGAARFTGLAAGTGDGYLVSVKRDGAPTRSRPFALKEKAGSLLVLRAVKITRDASAISLGRMSHIIAEVKDDQVDVVENLVFINSGDAPYDPGPDGIKLQLPANAEGAQAAPNGPPGLSVDGKLATFKGPLPPGETALTIAFVLPQKGDTVKLRQTVPFPLERVALVTDRLDGMNVEGAGLNLEEREMSGRPFWVVTGPAVPAGGQIDLALTGLPHASAVGRWIAVVVALLIVVWGLVASIALKVKPRDTRAALEQQRGKLLQNLAAVEAGGAAGPARDKHREELLRKLERVYRELDEQGAG